MSTANNLLMQSARRSLKNRWGLAIGTFLIYTLITCTFGAMRNWSVLSLLVSGPLILGAAIFSLSIARNKEARLEQIFDGFKFYSTALVTYLRMLLFIVLWSLLLIVPGIIEALSYSMSFYILADDPTLTPKQAMDKSKELMDGHKAKLFSMCLVFLLLALLCILTLGIGFLWLVPYANVSVAKFYDDINGSRHNIEQIGTQQ